MLRKLSGITRIGITVLCGALLLSGCGRITNVFSANDGPGESAAERNVREDLESTSAENARQSTVFDLFTNVDDPNTTIEVNKYLWNASLDILNFLPIQTADPFSGVIVTGFGAPPGGGRAYRATIFIRDPALEARSLNVALATRGGPAPTATVRAVEDAILTRARELRLRDLDL
ncbi:MAG: DUF3576 domain-containing protein [Pseudomonadota bacterium]